MFDFRRITLFCLEKRFSKQKMTIFSKNLGGHGITVCFLPCTGMGLCVRPKQYEVLGAAFFMG